MWNKAHQGFSPQSAFDELKMSPRVTRMKSSSLSFVPPLFHSLLPFFLRSFFFFLLPLLSLFSSCLLPSGSAESRRLDYEQGLTSAIGNQSVENRNLSNWIWMDWRSILDLLRRKWFEGSFSILSPDEKPLNTNLINDKPRPVGLV